MYDYDWGSTALQGGVTAGLGSEVLGWATWPLEPTGDIALQLQNAPGSDMNVTKSRIHVATQLVQKDAALRGAPGGAVASQGQAGAVLTNQVQAGQGQAPVSGALGQSMPVVSQGHAYAMGGQANAQGHGQVAFGSSSHFGSPTLPGGGIGQAAFGGILPVHEFIEMSAEVPFAFGLEPMFMCA